MNDNGAGISLEEATERLQNTTPEEFQQLMNYLESMENSTRLNEAGGVVFQYFTNANGHVRSVTARHFNPVQAIRWLETAEEYLRTMGYQPVSYKDPSGNINDVKKNSMPATPTSVSTPTINTQEVIGGGQPTTPAIKKGTGQLREGTGQIEVVEVQTLVLAFTRDNKKYLKVKGGRFTTWGIPAYKEILPEGLLDSLEVGKEYAPSPEMRLAWYDRDHKKVVRFGEVE